MFLQTERVTKKDLLQISPKLIQNKFALLNVKSFVYGMFVL